LKTGLLLGLLVCTMSFGQNQAYDFLDHIGLIKAVMPNIEKVGVMVGPQDYEILSKHMGVAQTQYGISLVPIRLNNVKKKLPQYVKTAATGVVKNHAIGALLFVQGEDDVTKSGVGIKFTAGSLAKKKVPVFSAHEKGNKLGCLGQFLLKDDQWVVQIRSSLVEKIGLTVPSGDPQIVMN